MFLPFKPPSLCALLQPWNMNKCRHQLPKTSCWSPLLLPGPCPNPRGQTAFLTCKRLPCPAGQWPLSTCLSCWTPEHSSPFPWCSPLHSMGGRPQRSSADRPSPSLVPAPAPAPLCVSTTPLFTVCHSGFIRLLFV